MCGLNINALLIKRKSAKLNSITFVRTPQLVYFTSHFPKWTKFSSTRLLVMSDYVSCLHIKYYTWWHQIPLLCQLLYFCFLYDICYLKKKKKLPCIEYNSCYSKCHKQFYRHKKEYWTLDTYKKTAFTRYDSVPFIHSKELLKGIW